MHFASSSTSSTTSGARVWSWCSVWRCYCWLMPMNGWWPPIRRVAVIGNTRCSRCLGCWRTIAPVGAGIAAMICGTLIILLALAVGQQASLPVGQRRHVALLVDEFHTLPAGNYEAFLAELAKYGASLVLATQSLGALDEVDPARGLRNTVFANVDHLFAFNCSAEDARQLALELGAPIEQIGRAHV